MTKEQKLKHCAGCRDDFYNGKNPHGVKECWMLESASLVSKKAVPIHQRPPWNQKPTKVLSCFHQAGFVFVDPHVTR